MSELGVSRRNLICGFIGAGAVVPLAAACGGSDTPSSGSTTATSAPAGGASSSAAAPSSSAAAAGSIQTSEIPVGGGKIFPDRSLIVTQPTQGEFKAFSSACTHQGSNINKVEDGAMICPLHGSKFAVADGAVQQGPASRPLPEKTVTVTGSTLEVSG